MHKWAILPAAVMVIGVTALALGRSEAAPIRGMEAIPAAAKNYSPIVKVGCGAPGPHCRPGRHWTCGPHGRCWCAPC